MHPRHLSNQKLFREKASASYQNRRGATFSAAQEVNPQRDQKLLVTIRPLSLKPFTVEMTTFKRDMDGGETDWKKPMK